MYKLKTLARPVTAAAYRTLVQGAELSPRAAVLGDGGRWRAPARWYVSQAAAESFLNGTSSVYVEEMYNAWLENPNSVHKVSSERRQCADHRSLDLDVQHVLISVFFPVFICRVVWSKVALKSRWLGGGALKLVQGCAAVLCPSQAFLTFP